MIDSKELLRRFTVACELKQEIDRARVADAIARWIAGLSEQPVTVRLVTTMEEAARDARAYGWEVSWSTIVSIGAAQVGNAELLAKWLPMLEAFEAGAFALWITHDAVVVATLPEIVAVDEERRLHGAPAFDWLGVKDYWHHGVLMPADVYEKPGALTVKRIMSETNAEVRRAMMSLYGRDKFLADAGAEVIDHNGEDHPVAGLRDSRLYAITVAGEDMRFIDLRDMAIQPDGSKRRYIFRVDPSRYDGDAGRLAHAAAASIHRRPEDRARLYWRNWRDYAPSVET